MIKQLKAYDFDGTIVDSSHRYQTQMVDGVEKIDLEHWIANEHKVMQDSLLPLAEQYKQDLLNPHIFVVVATARIWCDLTAQFAAIKGIVPDAIISRSGRQDQRGGIDLKVTGLNQILALPELCTVEEVHIFEDNADYLKGICDALGAIGHYIPSNQGH